MLKVCRPSIYKPLEMIFNQCLETGVFPCEWKKGNIVPIRKKGGQTDIEKLPSSVAATYLWENSWKIKLMFSEMFGFFIENKLISSNQSGFKPGDFCINQLLSIIHEIYSSFDEGLEVRSVFSISQGRYKVWHDGIISKLTQNGISGNLLNLLR